MFLNQKLLHTPNSDRSTLTNLSPSSLLISVFIEKLLRSTDVSKVYVLTRPKAGVDINERFSKILKDPVSKKQQLLKFTK